MARLESTIEIHATPETVFAVLADLPGYAEWNPFIIAAEGVVAEGAILTLRMQPPGRRPTTFTPTVVEVEPDRRIRWLGKLLVRGLFDGEHTLEVEPAGEDRSRFRQSEEFTGLLVPFAGGLLKSTQQGFRRMNETLKARAEERAALG